MGILYSKNNKDDIYDLTSDLNLLISSPEYENNKKEYSSCKESLQLGAIIKLYEISCKSCNIKDIEKYKLFIRLLKINSLIDIDKLVYAYEIFEFELNHLCIKKILMETSNSELNNNAKYVSKHVDAYLELDILRQALYEWINNIHLISRIDFQIIIHITHEYIHAKYSFNKHGKTAFKYIWKLIWNDYTNTTLVTT